MCDTFDFCLLKLGVQNHFSLLPSKKCTLKIDFKLKSSWNTVHDDVDCIENLFQ